MAGFLGSFKSFTSKELKKNLLATEPKVLELFEENSEYQLWQKMNMPKIIEDEKYYLQKMKYIHENPVRKSYVAEAEHWIYSSANPNSLLPLEDPNI